MISQETHDISARFFVDNTNYTTSIDSLWDNKTINYTLEIKKFVISTKGNLVAVLETKNLSEDKKQNIATLQTMYPWEIQVDQNWITIEKHIPMEDISWRNINRDGINIMKEWTFTPEWDAQERAFWISIDWHKKESKQELKPELAKTADWNDFL